MPPRRMTRAELQFSGALKINPGRYAERGNHSTLPRLGYAPKHLSAPEKALWRRLTNIAPVGLLTEADQFSAELAVRLIHRSRTTTAMKASELATLIGLLGKMGLTPVDRARLDIPAPESTEVNPFDEF